MKATHLSEFLAKYERSQSWLARKVGVSQTLMHYIVNGERTMSEEVALRIGEVFGEKDIFLFAEFTDVTDNDTQLSKAA